MSTNPRSASPPSGTLNLATVLATLLSLESKVDFIIGIDFGTTYTGVAYAQAVSREAVKEDPKRVAESIEIFRAWPNATQNYPDKIPTVLAYNQNPPIWGATVKSSHQPISSLVCNLAWESTMQFRLMQDRF